MALLCGPNGHAGHPPAAARARAAAARIMAPFLDTLFG
jgi:hypothetical protein